MYNIDAVTSHFFGEVLNIISRATVACCISYQGCFLIPEKAQCALPLLQRSETFTACASPVTIANNDANLHALFFVPQQFYYLDHVYLRNIICC
jgi:hypothetical protein